MASRATTTSIERLMLIHCDKGPNMRPAREKREHTIKVPNNRPLTATEENASLIFSYMYYDGEAHAVDNS